MVANEIERKFLVGNVPNIRFSWEKVEIIQFYTRPRPDNFRIRCVTHLDGRREYEQTLKVTPDPEDPTVRLECNVPLRAKEYKALAGIARRWIFKERYLVPLENGLTAYLDVFKGDLEGLRWVEVEFASKEQRDAFVRPWWIRHDISLQEWASNAYVAGRRFKHIAKHIAGLRSHGSV